MKKHVFLLLILFSASLCSAQETFVLQQSGTKLFNSPADVCIKENNNMIFLNNSFSLDSDISANELYELDAGGNILQQIVIEDSTRNYLELTHIRIINDTIYVFGHGYKNGSDPFALIILKKFDHQLNEIAEYEYRLPETNIIDQSYGELKYRNGFFYYFTSFEKANTEIPFYIKIKKSGEQLAMYFDYSQPYYRKPQDFIFKNDNNGFLSFMFCRGVEGYKIGGYLHSYDTTLSVDTIFSLPNDFFWYFDALVIDNSTYFLSGSWFDLYSWVNPYRLGLLKMNHSGDVISEFMYDDVLADSGSSPAYRNAIDMMADGNIILCSTNNMIIQQMPQLEPTYINLFKLTPDLDLIWQRYIGGNGKWDAFSMRMSPDGGIVIFAAYSEAPPTNWNKTELLFIKTNSEGIITGLEDGDPQIETSEAILFPNPAQDQITVDFSRVYHQANLQLIDISGKTVFNQHLTTNRQSVDISTLPEGTYAYRIFNSTGLDEQGKVVVE